MAKRSKLGIGLDVGSRSVQLAVLRPKKNGVVVERVASRELPHDALVEGLVMDSQVVCEKVAELLKECHLKGKDTAISVGGRRAMIKKITTDEMSDEELSSAIAFEAKENLPFDIGDVCFDYARLPQDMDSGKMEILLVAAKKDNVFDAVETLKWAGGKPVILEAEPFALQAALVEAGYLDDQSVVAALQIGFQSTDVTLFHASQFAGNRTINVGGKTYIEGLIRDLGITFERATSLLTGPSRTEDEQLAVDEVAREVGDRISEQVERSFPEFFGMGAESPASKVVLCGGGAHLPMLESALRHRLSTEVEVVNPFRHFEMDSKRVDMSLTECAPDYTSAVGLALRALGDKHPGFNLLFPSDKPGYRKTTYAGLGTVLPILGLSVMLLAIVVVHLSQENKLAGLRNHLKAVQKETALYSDKIALVEGLSKKRADVAARIDVITELDKNRFARVKLMQLLNNTLPDLTWLSAVQEVSTPRGPGFNLSGVSSSNIKVSQLMTALLQSPQVKGVDLLVSEQATISDITVTRFTLQVGFPDLGVQTPTESKPKDQLKAGTAAIKARQAATEKAQKEASK